MFCLRTSCCFSSLCQDVWLFPELRGLEGSAKRSARRLKKTQTRRRKHRRGRGPRKGMRFVRTPRGGNGRSRPRRRGETASLQECSPTPSLPPARKGVLSETPLGSRARRSASRRRTHLVHWQLWKPSQQQKVSLQKDSPPLSRERL